MLPSRPASTKAGIAASIRHAARTAALIVALAGMTTMPASADALGRGIAAFDRGDYIRATLELAPLAAQGNPRAQGLLGFLYEHGFGVPQGYEAAFDLYCRGAAQGDAFAQAMLGLMYDKGHGAHQDYIQAYKWLNLAAARARGRDRDIYLRFRDAVASKMSRDEIAVGQQLALSWLPGVAVPP
jgi:TPR repeat protein